MARPRKEEKDKVGVDTYTLRLTKEVSEWLEETRLKLQKETPYLMVTTTDALRYLITKGLLYG